MILNSNHDLYITKSGIVMQLIRRNGALALMVEKDAPASQIPATIWYNADGTANGTPTGMYLERPYYPENRYFIEKYLEFHSADIFCFSSEQLWLLKQRFDTKKVRVTIEEIPATR